MAAGSSPMELNGGSCVAASGRGCVAVAVDKRFGKGNELVSDNARRVLKLHSRLLCAFTGFTTDVQTLMQDLSAAAAQYYTAEQRTIPPAAAAALLSGMLYARRSSPYFCETILAGLDGKGQPFLRSHDVLGASGGENALDNAGAYAATGTSARSLYGMCEAFYSADLEPDELAEVVGKCLLAALERDCLSGQGAVVHLLTAEGVTSRELSAGHD
eukprot:13939-Heterococcus_DN1.PRE.2